MTTIASDLERLRRTHRARRTEQVLAALRESRRERASLGEVPPALDQAISDFSTQLTHLRAGLRPAAT